LSVIVRYIETLERPSQHHASSGTQTMSLQCNLRRHLLHKSSKPATHKVKGSTWQHVQGMKRSNARPRKHRLTCQPSMLRQAVPTSKQPCQARHLHPVAAAGRTKKLQTRTQKQDQHEAQTPALAGPLYQHTAPLHCCCCCCHAILQLQHQLQRCKGRRPIWGATKKISTRIGPFPWLAQLLPDHCC